MRRRSVLLLCDDSKLHADTVLDHIAALSTASRHRVLRVNPRGLREVRWLRWDAFDAVVVHYSLACVVDEYLSPFWREAIARFRGLKIQFIQDEYRWIDAVAATVADMGIDVIFSALPRDQMSGVYEPRLPGVRLEPTLTGYVPDRLVGLPVTDVTQRRHHVVYRGRELPFWIGDLGQDKRRIAEGVLARAAGSGLSVDIAWRESDRIYGRRWQRFLLSGRSTLGTGSGASIADVDGSIERSVREYLNGHPNAGYDEVASEVLRPFEGNIRFDVVSPRVFEAIALRTALVQFPGWYSGVVEPGRHYLVLQRDFSNFDEVAAILHDADRLRDLTEVAYREVVESGAYSYSHLTEHLDRVVDDLAPLRGRAYWPAAAGAAAARSESALRQWAREAGPLANSSLGRWPTLARFARDPAQYARKGTQALYGALTAPVARRLLVAWATDSRIRGRLPLATLLEDILELSLAAKAARAGTRLRLRAHYDRRTQTLNLVTGGKPSRGGDLAHVRAALSDGLLRVVWDHRAAGGRFDGGGKYDVFVGSDGRRELVSLVVLADRQPRLVARLLLPLFDASRGERRGDVVASRLN